MNTIPPKYQELLAIEELKQAYDHGYASVLIGAGFSLNVSNKLYTNWDELLSDMVWEIEGTTFVNAYQEYKSKKISDFLSEEDFRKNYIKEKVHTIGALDIASRYVHINNNMHEAIDTYIEEHIPYASINDDMTVSFMVGGKEFEKLPNDCLSIHKQLLNCNRFNSIFTTNYDNLLELAAMQTKKEIAIVKEGTQLANLGRKSKIVKIHGSLCESVCDVGFDGCDERYIITKEDYSDYKVRHPAFTNILRTEMLQNKICLIGFSGTDPNFRSCIDWLKQILGSHNENKEPKFYLVDLSTDENKGFLDRFYKNNYIKRINLFSKSTLDILGIQDATRDPKVLLEAFLNYLNSQNDEMPANVYDNQIVNAKGLVYDYRREWETVINKLYNGNYSSIDIKTIIEIRNIIRFFKIVFPQEHVISHLMTKESLTEEKAKLFALAVSDIGQIPSYYNNYHKDDIELNKQPIWSQLELREETLRGSIKPIEFADDVSTYEQIQRYLFHLDFSEAKDLVCKWDTKGHWIQSKAMRMSVYPELYDSTRVLLDNLIKKEKNPSEKLFEIILSNFISQQWPRPYSTEEFWRYGIDGQGDLLNSMMSSLRGKEEKPKRRNWIGSTHHFGDNNGDYCKSLRILQFIIDSGIYLNLPETYMFEIASWYKVFTNLYEHFPYPCFFYSIQYDDKDVLRRIGEDFAYNEGLQDFVQDILLKSLAAINNPDTPPSFKNGILNITAAMFVAVNEDLWFERFQETVFNEFCKNIKSKNDELLYNVKFAVGSIKRSDSIKVILQKLLRLLHENESVVSDIIVNNLMVDRLSASCLNDVDLYFENYLSPDTLDLLDTFHKANILPEGIRNDLVQVVLDANVDDIPKDRVALYQLTNLTCDNLNALEIVKQRYLSMDIWHCGVLSGNEFGWSEPHYIRLNLLNNKVSWNDEQFELIKQNLIKNVTAYDRVHETLHEDSFMKATQVRYLSDMLKYIDGLDAVRKSSLATVRDDVERLLADRTHYEDNIDFMMSDQSADVNYAFGNIYESVQARGVEYCKHDLDFLIDRAIMKRPIALTRNLRCIKFIMDSKSVEMLQAGYAKKLNKVLSIYLDSSSWQSLDLRFAFNYLRSIAKKLDEGNVLSEECSQFWLNNSFVKKFAVE